MHFGRPFYFFDKNGVSYGVEQETWEKFCKNNYFLLNDETKQFCENYRLFLDINVKDIKNMTYKKYDLWTIWNKYAICI